MGFQESSGFIFMGLLNQGFLPLILKRLRIFFSVIEGGGNPEKKSFIFCAPKRALRSKIFEEVKHEGV